jgi:hypothetical protein
MYFIAIYNNETDIARVSVARTIEAAQMFLVGCARDDGFPCRNFDHFKKMEDDCDISGEIYSGEDGNHTIEFFME